MTTRIASRRDHQKFCLTEQWNEVRNARGKATQHHITYELPLHDGRILRTRISRPANTNTYGKNLWAHILKDQLEVSRDEFWNCVNNGVLPPRNPSSQRDAAHLLPAGLAYHLVHTLHLSTSEIAALTLDQAVQLMKAHWESPPTGD